MNLILRPLNDANDPVWSVIISIIILLIGVSYYIYTIMTLAYEELKEVDGKESSSIHDCGTDNDAVHNHDGSAGASGQ